MPEGEVVLLLGADLGDPEAQFAQVERAIAERIGRVKARSRDHWTAPWGFAADTLFLNRALLITTELEPIELMNACLAVEQAFGRTRTSGGQITSRLIDIDVLLIGDQVLASEHLTVPHPRLHLRAFALAPLCDVLPAWTHPRFRRTALELLNALSVA